MKSLLGVFAALILAEGVAGQTLEELRAELAAVETQIAAREAARLEPAQVEALRLAGEAAQSAYEAEVAALPEVKELDRQIAELRSALRSAMRQRTAAIEAHRTALAEKQSAAEQAAAAYREAVANDRQLRRLAIRREELAKRVAEAEGQ